MIDHLETTDALTMADGPSTMVAIVVAAAPSVIWPLVTDLDLPARFSSEFQGAEWLDDTGPALGSRFVGHNRHGVVGEWSTTSTIVTFEPEVAYSWSVENVEWPAASWGFGIEALDPDADGTPRTRLTQWVRLGPGRSGLTPALLAMPDKEDRILRRRLAEHRDNMSATIDGIRQLAEAGDPN